MQTSSSQGTGYLAPCVLDLVKPEHALAAWTGRTKGILEPWHVFEDHLSLTGSTTQDVDMVTTLLLYTCSYCSDLDNGSDIEHVEWWINITVIWLYHQRHRIDRSTLWSALMKLIPAISSFTWRTSTLQLCRFVRLVLTIHLEDPRAPGARGET